MIVLNECRITEDGKYLVIEASVDSLAYYENVYISNIIIDTDKTYIPDGPSSNPIYEQEFEGLERLNSDVMTDTDCKCGNIYTSGGSKSIRLKLSSKDLDIDNLNSNIFFVYLIASGYPAPDTPCGMDNSTVMGIAYNKRLIYNKAIGAIKELNDSCNIPKNFIDIFLKYKAFTLALKTGHFTEAIKIWKYLKNSSITTISRGCGCHGNK